MALTFSVLVTAHCAGHEKPGREGRGPIPDPWAAIDAHALAVPNEISKNPEALAKYLIGPARSDLERARAIFRWISANIDYDLEAARKGFGGAGAEEALSKRMAVCGGFSDLFVHLAGRAGLEAVQISGWARGMNYSVGDPVNGAPNHAWNAVKVEGRWLLLDCTWAAGAIDETGTYQRRFDGWYFDPPPEKLIFTHLPEESRWQLLGDPVNRDTFERMPYLRSTFFAMGFELASPATCCIESENGRAEVSLVKPQGSFVMTRLYRDGLRMSDDPLRLREAGGNAVVEAKDLGPGEYTLRIFAGDASTTEGRLRRYEWAADFKVTVQKGR